MKRRYAGSIKRENSDTVAAMADKGGSRPILMIGAFPPPVRGLPVVNGVVRERLRAAEIEPKIIDLASLSMSRSLIVRLGRMPKVLLGLVRLAGMRGLRGATLYMSVSGGLGQIYECLFLVIARLRKMRVFLHHHNFTYLDKLSRIAQAVIKMAGSSALHITQCSRMADRLNLLYAAARVMPVSNAVFLLHEQSPPVARRLRVRTLGYISNIAAEKGIFEFLDLMEVVRAANLPLKGILAGPFQDSQTERAVRARLDQLKNVEYVGPRYGAEKDLFFQDIDVLIFPTSYLNETEGIVNLEAMSRGVPVIAYGRGCIPEIVGPDCGRVIDPTEPFVPAALDQVKAWLFNQAAFQAASRSAVQRFSDMYIQSKKRWLWLLTELLGRPEMNSAKDGQKTEAASQAES
jgi:glycosyltransferase involved in cell wall biosynthesis